MIKINRSVGMQSYNVGIGDGMSIDIISILRSNYHDIRLINTSIRTGYSDEMELLEKTKIQPPKERAESLALFRKQEEVAKAQAYLETCVTDWDVYDTEGEAVPFSINELKKLFLSDENIHQVKDLIKLSMTEELFWIKETIDALKQVKK